MRKAMIVVAVLMFPGCVCFQPGEPNDDTSEPAGEPVDGAEDGAETTGREPAPVPKPET